MSAVDLSLVNDGFTWSFTLGFAAFVGTLWLGVKFIQAWDRARAGLDEAIADIAPRVCVLHDCDQPPVRVFHVSDGPLYACRAHSGEVARWCGPSVPFDQEQGGVA